VTPFLSLASAGITVAAVREFGPSPVTLAGSLLIAHPALLDPNFRKTVLLLSTHSDEEGSFALILNRPADRTVGEVLPHQELGPLARVPLFLGGPVSQDQLVFAAFRWRPDSDRLECRHHLMIGDAQEAVEEEDTVVRAFVGYAGWSKGQLEAELAQKAWLVTKPARDVLAIEKCPTLWRELTSGFGPWFKMVAEAPDDPSVN
jgi:putative transcriptional regulator